MLWYNAIVKIEKLLKIISSKTKLRLITHFYSCKCNNHDVSHMIKKVQGSQSLVSRSINELLRAKVLEFFQIKKKKILSH